MTVEPTRGGLCDWCDVLHKAVDLIQVRDQFGDGGGVCPRCYEKALCAWPECYVCGVNVEGDMSKEEEKKHRTCNTLPDCFGTNAGADGCDDCGIFDHCLERYDHLMEPARAKLRGETVPETGEEVMAALQAQYPDGMTMEESIEYQRRLRRLHPSTPLTDIDIARADRVIQGKS